MDFAQTPFVFYRPGLLFVKEQMFWKGLYFFIFLCYTL